MLIPSVEDEEAASEEPTVKADGGVTNEAEESNHSDDRPHDCDCTPPMEDLPYWPCYRDSFEESNPDVEESGYAGRRRGDIQRIESWVDM